MGYIYRYVSTISDQGFLLSKRIRKVFTTHCFNRSYYSAMVRKPVRLLCYMFLLAFWDLALHSLQ